MKLLLEKVHYALKQRHYTKSGASFSKIENGFYKLIHFQKGAFGGYFFINVGLHPVGLPQLIVDALSIPEKPKEHECFIRERVDQIIKGAFTNVSERTFVYASNPAVIETVIEILPEIENWLTKWSSFEVLAKTPDQDLEKLMPAVPILKKKAIAMMRYFCAIKLNNNENIQKWLKEYLSIRVPGLIFPEVDAYLKSLDKKNEPTSQP
jgi:hypothetical protein